MSELPSILVTDGWETDENGILQEVVIPSTVETLQVPNKVTFMGTTLNAIPSTVAALQEIDCPNLIRFASNNFFQNFTGLITASFNGVTSTPDAISSQSSAGLFYGCSNLTTLNMPNLITIGKNGSTGCGHFKNCGSLANINMPKLEAIKGSTNNGPVNVGTFYSCIGLTTLTLPSLSVIEAIGAASSGVFYGCTGLTTVQLGSEGHPVTAIGGDAFNGCTQSGLTITVYTTGGVALSGSPWGATNATIVYEEA